MARELVPKDQMMKKPRRRGQSMTAAERKEAKRIIIQTMENTANVRAAALAAHVHYTTVYRWVQEDPKFAKQFNDANEAADMMLFGEGWKRALVGEEQYVVSAGKLVYGPDGQPLKQRVKSDRLLEVYLKARLPRIFGDKADITLKILPKQYLFDADVEGTVEDG